MFRYRLHDQEARPVVLSSPPTQDELAVLPERLEDVCRKLNHGRRGASAIGIPFSFPEDSEKELIFGSAKLFLKNNIILPVPAIPVEENGRNGPVFRRIVGR